MYFMVEGVTVSASFRALRPTTVGLNGILCRMSRGGSLGESAQVKLSQRTFREELCGSC